MMNGLLPDSQIRILAVEGMIEPFAERPVHDPMKARPISYGLSSYGYDPRLGSEFKVFHDVSCVEIDPKAFSEEAFVEKVGDYCTIPPNSFVLAATLEYFRIPNDIMVLCVGKSTYARCGVIVNVTPLEPGWEGNITLEISNTAPLPARVYAMEGICQLLFFRCDPCERPYHVRSGKYQGQRGVTLPRT